MKSKIFTFFVIMGLALGGFSSAFGSSGYMSTFNTANGTTYNCGVCHTTTTGSSSARVQFGADWARLRGGTNSSNYNYSVATNCNLANVDSDGDGMTNIAEIQAKTNPGVAAPPSTDTTRPTVNTFTIPSSASSLTVSPISLTASDPGGSGVNGYMVTAMTAAPAPGATGWSACPPTSFSLPTGTSGSQTLYAWAKDVRGNVSTSRSGTVTITTGSGVDVESPEVMEFTLPLTSTSPTVPILAFRAIDNVEATEHLITYLITTTSAAPAANAAGWSTTPPASYTFPSGGSKKLYGWAKDAAGNISESVWDNVDLIAAPDQTPPVVTSFSIPSTSRTFAVLIRKFTATDNTAVTGYLVTTGLTKPGLSNPNWRSTPPTSFTFTSTGRKRLYAWAKDAAGNVSSASRYGTVMVLGNNQEEDD